MKLAIPSKRQEQIQVGSRNIAVRHVFDLKLWGIHLTEIILKVWVINEQYVIDVLKLNWDANRFLPAENKDCINSASYKYRYVG